jgi:hypothetical protein
LISLISWKKGVLPMANFETTEFIQCPPQTVFEYLTNPANMAKWQANTVSAEWTSAGTPGIGSTFKVVSKAPGGTIEAVLEITIWEPSICQGFKSTTMPFPFKGIAGVTTLTPKENGTQLTLQGQVTTVGIFKLVEGLISKQVGKQDASNIQTLKQLLEAGA